MSWFATVVTGSCVCLHIKNLKTYGIGMVNFGEMIESEVMGIYLTRKNSQGKKPSTFEEYVIGQFRIDRKWSRSKGAT